MDSRLRGWNGIARAFALAMGALCIACSNSTETEPMDGGEAGSGNGGGGSAGAAAAASQADGGDNAAQIPGAAWERPGKGTLRVGSVAQPLHDVTLLEYRVVGHEEDCSADPVAETVEPASSEFRFAEESLTLDSGLYRLCVTPWSSQQTPSAHCDVHDERIEVVADAVAEVSLAVPCEPVLHPVTGHAYTITPKVLTYQEAEEAARELGGYLVVITSQEEEDFLHEHFSGSAWMGLKDEELDKTWEWVTGEEFTFNAWCEGEPNQAGPEFWGEWNFRGQGCWNDASLESRKGLVEIEP